MVIIVFGLPGTGKVKFAQRLAQYLQFDFLNTAAIRRKWIASPSFSKKEKEAVYLNLLQEMSEHTLDKKNLVLEGTFYLKSIRRDFHDVADILNTEVYWIEIVSDTYNSGWNLFRHDPAISDKFSIYRTLLSSFEPMDSKHLVLEYTRDSRLNDLIRLTLKSIPGLMQNGKSRMANLTI
ncbi:AAA family ATPase [Fulvivirga sedimenti]|uniref:AAA family ATPase n=1 Tax=Fulvivirga sedimenti TaxID=2879465 RepID=A0A9X1HVA1_9BACT|nr:AAA family ATPase [Fulvivirga sedimenti]MCA6074794.1 AAA family ATPase [Fulvivirga sedimenti]MCA6075971.1 AAA family ATPase [Fulvivirga sedimenti]MCA6077099.1 AAA family ATPase [Fulvivirga sedimenti]